MWDDDFDARLYAVLPEAREVIAPVANVELVTTGSPSGGKLNHPDSWNGYEGMVSYFGFGRARPSVPQENPNWQHLPPPARWRPADHYTSSPEVNCTFEEAMRDLWVHNLVMYVEGKLVMPWQGPNGGEMMELMQHLRGWVAYEPKSIERIKRSALVRIEEAVENLLHLMHLHHVPMPAAKAQTAPEERP